MSWYKVVQGTMVVYESDVETFECRKYGSGNPTAGDRQDTPGPVR